MVDAGTVPLSSVMATEIFRIKSKVREIEQFATLRAKDVSLEPHERAQWRRMIALCKAALGEKDG